MTLQKTAKILDGEILATKIKLDLLQKINPTPPQGAGHQGGFFMKGVGSADNIVSHTALHSRRKATGYSGSNIIEKQKNKPGLAAILVGDDPASFVYVNLKEKACREIGINFHKYLCNQQCYNDISEKELIELIKFLNNDKQVNGIIVQLPLPKKFDTQKIINTISPQKDVDGFHPKNKKIIPPTIASIIKLLESTKQKLENKKTLIIGKSNIFTDGLKKYLLEKLNITNIDNQKSIPKNSKDYDIIIMALGSAKSLKKTMVKENAIVIDVGTNKIKDKIIGDVDSKVAEVAGFISPVPGGVGPLTVACLLENTFILSQK